MPTKNILHKCSAAFRLQIAIKTSCLHTVCIICFSLMPTSIMAEKQTKAYSESVVKAALIYNILHFIEWPTKDLEICIYGANEQDVSSFNLFPSSTKAGNALLVTFLHKNGTLLIPDTCQIIFITGEAKINTRQFLAKTKNPQSVTIGESRQFIKQGGMINFVHKGSNIRFEINADAFKKAGLIISSQVLRIADRVYMGDDNE